MTSDYKDERQGRIPRLYETENIPAEEKLIYHHFFIADSHWYAAEFDGEDIFFGYAILNGDMQNAEWGYFSLQELKSVKVGPLRVEVDCSWEVKAFIGIPQENNNETD
jgi:hypothetical protein